MWYDIHEAQLQHERRKQISGEAGCVPEGHSALLRLLAPTKDKSINHCQALL